MIWVFKPAETLSVAEELSAPRHIQAVMRGLRTDNAQFQGVTGQKKKCCESLQGLVLKRGQKIMGNESEPVSDWISQLKMFECFTQYFLIMKRHDLKQQSEPHHDVMPQNRGQDAPFIQHTEKMGMSKWQHGGLRC